MYIGACLIKSDLNRLDISDIDDFQADCVDQGIVRFDFCEVNDDFSWLVDELSDCTYSPITGNSLLTLTYI